MMVGGATIFFMAAMAVQADGALPPPPAPPSVDGYIEPGRPTTNPGTWVTNSDYPARAMREEREGTTGFRLSYDASGLPQTCDIVSSSGHVDLDTATCDLTMSRARFQPGKDGTGKAVGGTYTNRIRWKIPAGPLSGYGAEGDIESLPRGPVARAAVRNLDMAGRYPKAALDAGAEGDVGFRLDVDAAGAVQHCTVTQGSGSAALDAATCAILKQEGQFDPALDIDGKPVAGRVNHYFVWRLPPPGAAAAADTAKPDRRPPPFPPEPGSMKIEYVIDAQGAVVDCTAQTVGFMAKGPMGAEMRDGCAPVRAMAPYQPPLDDARQPVGRRYRLIMETQIEDVPATGAAPK
jgi:TonB family protein